jgi:hypothetical protein
MHPFIACKEQTIRGNWRCFDAIDTGSAPVPSHFRESNDAMLRISLSHIRLVHILAAGVVLLGAGCAGAKVGDLGSHADSGTTDGGFQGNCDPIANSGCPSVMKCTTLQNGQTFSVGCGSKGTKAAGDICTQVGTTAGQTGDDCGDGLACFSVQGDASATCHQICSPSGAGTACPTKFVCGLDVGLVTLAFCRASCQPLEQSGCASNEACYLASTGAVCSTAGKGSPGAPCSSANDCVPGSTCILVSGSSGTCYSFCSTTGGTTTCSATDTGGTTCTALTPPLPEPNAGVCR